MGGRGKPIITTRGQGGARYDEHVGKEGQSAILDAIASLRTELLAKVDEKAELQNTEFCR